METLIKYFAHEGRVIVRVPAAFAMGIALLGTLIWTTLNWQYSEQIANLNSRIRLRDDQIAEYRNRLDEAAPHGTPR